MFGLMDVSNRYVTFGMEIQNALNVRLGMKHFLECFVNYDSHLVPPFQRVLFLSLGNIVVNFVHLFWTCTDTFPTYTVVKVRKALQKTEWNVHMVNYIPYLSPHKTL
jgi:hypothetical protein